MISIDTLTCQVTPDSVEPTSLSCAVPPLKHLALWDSILSNAGTWATVVLTGILAYFAWMAWKTSQITLTKMEYQIVANKDLAVDTRQRELLADYTVALLEMADNMLDPNIKFEELLLKVTTTWTKWAMEMFTIDLEFRELTGEWNSYFKNQSFEIHDSFVRTGSVFAALQQEQVSEQVGQYVGSIQVWQVDPDRRSQIHKRFKDIRKVDADA